MGLFWKKKDKKEDNANFSDEISRFGSPRDMPDLPELPKSANKISNFPGYESEIGSIKEEIGRGSPRLGGMLEIPVRRRVIAPTTRLPNIGILSPQEAVSAPRGVVNKPVFVKIEKYRDAVDNLENIKDLCKNADSLLGEINRLREEENAELEKWRSDIGKIKDKLLSVDKKLFEG